MKKNIIKGSVAFALLILIGVFSVFVYGSNPVEGIKSEPSSMAPSTRDSLQNSSSETFKETLYTATETSSAFVQNNSSSKTVKEKPSSSIKTKSPKEILLLIPKTSKMSS